MTSKLFTLEALAAKHGDCLLLHWGSSSSPRLILIDGGPSGVYNSFLRKRLTELNEARQDSLPIELVMLSHIDDDHINGLLMLFDRMEELEQDNRAVPYSISSLWANSLDDIVGNSSSASVAPLSGSNVATVLPQEIAHTHAVVASVRQGRKLRDAASRMGLTVNGGDPLITGGWIWDMGDGLSFQVIGPLQEQVDEFREAWDKELVKKGWDINTSTAEVAAYLDNSPWNLASIIVYVKQGSKTMLLTGDARGDHIIKGLREGGLLTNSISVDILKVPHHGSDNNVSTDFFRTVKAKHYIISGDGRHGNPEISTLRMIFEARGNAKFKIHCTYRVGKEGLDAKLTQLLNDLSPANRKKLVFRKDADLSMKVELGSEKLRD